MPNRIIHEIKKNKKYAGISDALIQKEIQDYFKTHQKMQNKALKKSEIKNLVKEIRKKLHRSYASYQTKKKNDREEYLNELKNAVDNNDKQEIIAITKKLLTVAVSTKERLNDYEIIYKKIFEITSKPKTIIDLGAGLNPLSFPFMNLEDVQYYAYDINEQDKEFLQEYFAIMNKRGLHGKAEILDLKEKDAIEKLPEVDIIFIFKLIDLLDTKNKKISEKIITNLFKKKKTKYIVASFATKTLSQKSMHLPKRIGFEKMLQRNDLHFETFSTENEIFYVISEK